MKYIRFGFLLLIAFSLLFETTVINFPFVFLFSVLYFVIFRKTESVFLIFVVTFILDSIKGGVLGATSLFVFCALFLLNSRFWAIDTHEAKFVFFYLLIATLLYSVVFSYGIAAIPFIIIFSLFGVLTLYLTKHHVLY